MRVLLILQQATKLMTVTAVHFLAVVFVVTAPATPQALDTYDVLAVVDVSHLRETFNRSNGSVHCISCSAVTTVTTRLTAV